MPLRLAFSRWLARFQLPIIAPLQECLRYGGLCRISTGKSEPKMSYLTLLLSLTLFI
jgi:hypothetical protein